MNDLKTSRKNNPILAIDNKDSGKTPKQITCGLRTELISYDGYYLTEENAIKAMQLYNRTQIEFYKDKIKKLEDLLNH